MKRVLTFSVIACMMILVAGTASAVPFQDGKDVWYLFTPNEAGNYSIKLEDSFDGITLAVFSGLYVTTDQGRIDAVPDVHGLYSAPVNIAAAKDDIKLIRVAGKRFRNTYRDGEFKISITKEKVCAEAPVISAPESVLVACEARKFADAFEALEAAFAVTAANECGDDFTGDVRVSLIAVTDPENGEARSYTVDQINEELVASGKLCRLTDGEDYVYEGTVEQTKELFQYYFLFNPGAYTVTYTVAGADDVAQSIMIDSKCDGCMGCYGCKTFSGCRPTPMSLDDVKGLLSQWLLVGLSALVLASWSVLRRD